jgi:6-phosphogluconolactonase
VILQYRFDVATGKLTPNVPPSVATKAGAGPRHFVFSPDQRFVYSTNELDATVNTYAYDRQNGTLTLQASDSALPEGFKSSEQLAAADLHLTPDGRFSTPPSAPPIRSPAIALISATGKLSPHPQHPHRNPAARFQHRPAGRYLLAVGQRPA